MEVSKNPSRQKLKEKHCEYPDCNKIFFGIKVAKYCDEHKKPEYRVRNYESVNNVGPENQVIKHSFCETVDTVQVCECCGDQFPVKIFPRVTVYPRYCPEHRTEHRRKQFAKLNLSRRN